MPAKPCTIYAQALLAWHRREPTGAQELLANTPLDRHGHALLGRICEARFDDTSAETHYLAALSQSPLNDPGWLDYGRLLYRQGRYAEAERALIRSMVGSPSSTNTYRELVQLLLAQRHYKAALQIIHSILQSDPQHPFFGALRNYAEYLSSNHKVFLATIAKTQLFFPITGTAPIMEMDALAMRYGSLFIFKCLSKHVGVGDVCLDIGAGMGLYSILMGGLCGATAVIPFDPRPLAKEALCYAAKKNEAPIETSHLSQLPADGNLCIEPLPKAPLDKPLRPALEGSLLSTPLDKITLPRVNFILNQSRHMARAFLEGARYTLVHHRPRCLLRVEALELKTLTEEMQRLGYRLDCGDYTEDGQSLFCLFLPNKS